MKKTSYLPIHTWGVALLLLAANTDAFAQRREGGREGRVERPQSMPQVSRPQHMDRPMNMPGRPQPERPRNDRPVQVQRPTPERPMVQRPTPSDNNPARPGMSNGRPNYGWQGQRGNTPGNNPVTRPGNNNVRNNDVADINRNRGNNWNNNNNRPDWNRGNNWNNNRVRVENHVVVNRPRPGFYYRGNMNYYRPRPVYNRPPVIWGGRRYYTHYNYYYHPYRPYYYGSFFHPFGFYLGSLSSASIIFSWNNIDYGYDNGVFYQPYNNGYQVVPAPTGANIRALPMGYTTVQVDNDTYYYFAGTFYVTGADGFEIVAAPPGAIVYDLPEGANEVHIDDMTYLEYGGNYYQPVFINGRDGYEVVDIRDNDY